MQPAILQMSTQGIGSRFLSFSDDSVLTDSFLEEFSGHDFLKPVKIAYQLKPGVQTSVGLKNITPWTCDGRAQSRDRALLAPEMQPYFNFTIANLWTNLKILVMGDSVGIQISEYLQSLLQLENMKGKNHTVPKTVVLKEALGMGKKAIAIHATALIPSGDNKHEAIGAIAGWRLIGMLQRKSENWAPANYNCGWHMEDVHALNGHVNETPTTTNQTITTTTTTTTNTSIPNGNFDVFVFRIPSPSWISLREVTPETLHETVELAHELFGAKVVIFVSMHYNNNVLTNDMRIEMAKRNQMVSDFAQNWTIGSRGQQNATNLSGGGVHTIFVLDHGRLSDELMEWNARLIGFDTNNKSDSGSGIYTDEKLKGVSRQGKIIEHFRLSVGHVCAKKVPHESDDCVRNAVTRDGMHPCMNIVGPRVAAGLACQIQCAYSHDTSMGSKQSWDCAQACNDQYMSATSTVAIA